MQIESMKNAESGGFFMHSRDGLKAPFMSEEFLAMTGFCIKKAEELGMEAWTYDEFGRPGGFADGKAPALGYDHQQKSLRFTMIESPDRLAERLLGVYRKTGTRFTKVHKAESADTAASAHVNKNYIDALNKDAITAFIGFTHEKYADRYTEKHARVNSGIFFIYCIPAV